MKHVIRRVGSCARAHPSGSCVVQPGVSWDPKAVRKGVGGSGGGKAMLAHAEEDLGMHVCGKAEGIMLDHANWPARAGVLLLSLLCLLCFRRHIYLKERFC